MTCKVYAFGFLLTIFIISCNNRNEEGNPENSELNTKETTRDKKNVIRKINNDSIIKILQGQWQAQYPYGPF